MTTVLTIKAGHDVAYFTRGNGTCGCTGAMSYYTAGGEPPGQWTGKAAERFGLRGEVDPDVIGRLYQKDIAPTGELLVKPRVKRSVLQRMAAAVNAYRKAHPFASAVEIAEVLADERGKDPHRVPYFDVVITVVKSVSVLHASYRVAAHVARQQGKHDEAAGLGSKADAIEDALMEVAREVVAWLERHGCYTRTGYHSSTTGEWRDGAGFVGALFMHHLSRDGDPHLHVHIPILNRVQLADGSDDKWRTLDSRTLHQLKLGVAALADRLMEVRLSALGYQMKTREDGNGAEVMGVSKDVMDLFSSRAVAVTDELKRLAEEYMRTHGTPPSRRTLWLLHQQAGQNTRRSKGDARRRVAGRTGSNEPTEAERLAAWERQTTAHETATLSAVHEEAEAVEPRATAVLDYAAKCRAARIAVAEVQKHHAVWGMPQLRFEIHRALPVLPHTADVDALLTEVAQLAISNRAGTDVVQVTSPDAADVTELGVRDSDGGSVYRPPNEERYCTIGQLDMEAQIIASAKRKVPQLVSEPAARLAVAKTDLNAEQAEAVVKMLTAGVGTVALVAPAGSGKSHAMAVFADLWHRFTGGRVIGLTTSTNAAKVLQAELDEQAPGSQAETYNIARFLGKVKGKDYLRRPVAVHERDVLVLDEATQVGTKDFGLVQESAKMAGARLNPVGDTMQLGSVDAGGIFRLVAQEVPSAELHEIRRFNQQWERDASVRIGLGEIEAVATYDTHGRIWGADEQAAYEQAATSYLADHLAGRQVLLLAGSNGEAAELARLVQEKLIRLGQVDAPELPLSDGNQAGRGDRVRARLNTHIDAAGQRLTNRDTLRILGYSGPDVRVERQRLDGTWTAPFIVPRAYLETDAELDYAGNTHVAQGRTVEVGHLLVTPSLSRQSNYVGMTRGRDGNYAYVVTGQTAPPGREPYEQATPEAVIKGVMQREAEDLSATEQMRISQEWTGGSGHVVNLWAAAVNGTIGPEIDNLIKANLDPVSAGRYDHEASRPVLQGLLRAHQLAGHDLRQLIPQIAAEEMTGARSVSSVLHGRLVKMNLPLNSDATWSQRTPEQAPQLAHELADALDHRVRELGERCIEQPQPWLLDHLGVLAPDASPAMREEYARRAGVVQSYRESAGITDPEQAVSFEAHGSSPELEAMRASAMNALEMTEAPVRSMSRGQLEARVLEGQRAMAAEPESVAEDLQLTAQAEQDARRQAAEAQVNNDRQAQLDAEALEGINRGERVRLEALQAGYDDWSARTRDTRLLADEAQKELERRGEAGPEEEPERDEPEVDPYHAPDGQPEVESEADFQLRLCRMVYGKDPEPEPEQYLPGPEHQGETETEFQARLATLVRDLETEPEEPEAECSGSIRYTATPDNAPTSHVADVTDVAPTPQPVLEATPEPEHEPPPKPALVADPEPEPHATAEPDPEPERHLEPIKVQRSDAEWRMDNARIDAEEHARREAEQERAARLDELQARADAAAARAQAERDETEARAKYAAEVELEPEPEADPEPEMADDHEMEIG